MDGRTFLSKFLKAFHAKAMLPGDLSPRGMQDVSELIFLLDGKIDPHRIQRAFVEAVNHLMRAPDHVGRSYPRRLSELLSNPPAHWDFKPEMLANSLAKACSCDYLEWPRPEDWRRDEHLNGAVHCTVLDTMCSILPITEYIRNAIKVLPFSPRHSAIVFLSQTIDDYRVITSKVPELVGKPKSFQSFGARLVQSNSPEDQDKMLFALKVLLLTTGNEKRSDEDLAAQIRHLKPIPDGTMN